MYLRLVYILLIAFVGLSCKKDTVAATVIIIPPVVVPSPVVPAIPGRFKGGVVSADGTSNTYELINKYLGGTGDVIEAPDCAHPAFGAHIKQVYDNFLKKNVFAFYIHVTPDNDRCLPATDRQRNEIKTYDKSPDSLLATLGETVLYKWKFKLDKDFKPSPNFTHLHQIKGIDGDDDMPIITFTARFRSAGNRLELIHTAGKGKSTSLGNFANIPLNDISGNWIEVTEKLTYRTAGTYEVQIKRMSDNRELLNVTRTNIDLWRDATTKCRPKWGIYRSLLSPTFLRDETVLFNDFSITEIKN